MSSKALEPTVQPVKETSDTVELPAPTTWPIVLALGLTLLFTGLVTSPTVSVLGAILAAFGCAGWFRAVLPHEKHESVPVRDVIVAITTGRPQVAQMKWITQELHRARLPLEIYPISAGVKGGLAGGVVMAVLAVLYGIISGHGIWYPINLLSAGFFSNMTTMDQLATFRADAFMIAALLHLICSLLVGLLYGATLPMLPGRPILLGGILAPILWSGLLHSMLEAVDPALKQLIDWPWFVVSQIGFGVVAGFVVSKQAQVHIRQYLPFAVRAGIEAPGIIAGDHNDGDGRQP
jgi:hypothetical protein